MKDIKGLFLMLGGVALFIIIVGLITKTNRGETTILSPYLRINQTSVNSTPVPTDLPNLKKITIGNTIVMASIANTAQTRQKGLSGVTAMPSDQGMLFVFDSKNLTPEMAKFWMKDMKIALDFIWISNNVVAEITPNVEAPAAGTPDNQLKIYQPNGNIDYILEVDAGFANRNNIKVGDQFIFQN